MTQNPSKAASSGPQSHACAVTSGLLTSSTNALFWTWFESLAKLRNRIDKLVNALKPDETGHAGACRDCTLYSALALELHTTKMLSKLRKYSKAEKRELNVMARKEVT